MLGSLRLWVIAVIPLAVLLSPGLTDGADILLTPIAWAKAVRQRAADTETLVQMLRQQPAPVLCEANVLCYWAGKPFSVDRFNVGQALRLGIKQPDPLSRHIRSGEYSAIQLSADPTLRTAADEGAPIVSPADFQFLKENYVLVPVPLRGVLLFRRPQPSFNVYELAAG